MLSNCLETCFYSPDILRPISLKYPVAFRLNRYKADYRRNLYVSIRYLLSGILLGPTWIHAVKKESLIFILNFDWKYSENLLKSSKFRSLWIRNKSNFFRFTFMPTLFLKLNKKTVDTIIIWRHFRVKKKWFEMKFTKMTFSILQFNITRWKINSNIEE